MNEKAGGLPPGPPSPPGPAGEGLATRLLSRKAGAMLVRNTVVSCLVFGLSIAVLWALVELLGVDAVVAAAIGFLIANTLHYALGRAWIFAGSERGVTTGYMLFLATSGVGLVVTVALYAALLRFTPIDYLIARVLVSLVAGLIMFVINATLNFHRL